MKRYVKQWKNWRTQVERLYLWVLVPSGCHGYSYLLEYSDGADLHTHKQFSFDALTVYIDNKSLPMLEGMTLDYAYEGLNEGFKFVNPNLTNECGCGESVSA